MIHETSVIKKIHFLSTSMVPHKSWWLYHLIKVKIVQEFYSFSYLFISTLRAVFGHGLLSRLFPSLRLLLKNEQYGFKCQNQKGGSNCPSATQIPTALMVIRRLGGFHSIFGRQAVDCCCESQRWGKNSWLKDPHYFYIKIPECSVVMEFIQCTRTSPDDLISYSPRHVTIRQGVENI